MRLSSAGRVVGRIALVLAVVALLAVALPGPGNRLGVWGFRTGLRLMSYGAYAALAAAALALVGLLMGGARRLSALALVIGLASFGGPYALRRVAQSVPPIHDISTDTANPPIFVAVLARRTGASNAVEYGGDAIAAQQRAAYPDVQPLQLPSPPPQAFERALAAARAMGWEIVDAQPAEGRLEATATTPWFGFKDDVVVRIRPHGGGSVVDVRSLSRVGRSDLGANAKRIRAYLERLRSAS
jgi:uncharacterized protein (DUF1499 family)